MLIAEARNVGVDSMCLYLVFCSSVPSKGDWEIAAAAAATAGRAFGALAGGAFGAFTGGAFGAFAGWTLGAFTGGTSGGTFGAPGGLIFEAVEINTRIPATPAAK